MSDPLEGLIQNGLRAQRPAMVNLPDAQLLGMVAGSILAGTLVRNADGNFEGLNAAQAVGIAVEVVAYTVAAQQSGRLGKALVQAMERAKADMAAAEAAVVTTT